MKTVEGCLLEMVDDWRETNVDDWLYHRWQERLKTRADCLLYCSNILEEFVHTHPELKNMTIVGDI